jgi:acetyl esterase
MPLEPSLRELGRAIGAAFPSVPSSMMSAEEARRRARGRTELANAGPATAPPGERVVVRWRDHSLAFLVTHAPGNGQRFVLFLHSGGWVAGSAESCARACAAISRSLDATVLALDYPLAPEYPYPAALDATCAALEWMSSDEFIRPGTGRQIVIAGESAGGNLAASALLRQRDEGAQARVCAGMLLVPVLDHDFTRVSYAQFDRGDIDGRSGMHWYSAQYLGDRCAELSSCPYVWPLRARSLAGLPPIVLVQAQYDPMCDEQDEFSSRVLAEGGTLELLRYEGVGHSFFGLDHLSPTARQAQSEVCEVVGRFLMPAAFTSGGEADESE